MLVAAARNLQAGDPPQYHRANSYTAGGVAPGPGPGFSFSSTSSVIMPGHDARRDVRPPSYEAVQTLVAMRANGREAHAEREVAARSANDADGYCVNEGTFRFAG